MEYGLKYRYIFITGRTINQRGHNYIRVCGCVGMFDKKGPAYMGKVSDKQVRETGESLWHKTKICQILKLGSLLVYEVCAKRVKATGNIKKWRGMREHWAQKKSWLMRVSFNKYIYLMIFIYLSICSSTKGYKHIVTCRKEMRKSIQSNCVSYIGRQNIIV